MEESIYLTDKRAKREEIKAKTEKALELKMNEVTLDSCLNVLVTTYFLQLNWVYQKVWTDYFTINFSEVVNTCRISLSNINPIIVKDIANRISELSLENMEERKDKFISNIYKARLDSKILMKEDIEADSTQTQNI